MSKTGNIPYKQENMEQYANHKAIINGKNLRHPEIRNYVEHDRYQWPFHGTKWRMIRKWA